MISKPLIINIFCIIWSCFILSCTNTQVQSKKSALCTWLSKPQHVNLKNYKDTFITRYQLLIANDSLNEAASLFDAYGKALDLRFEYDSFYVGACKNFMKTYENKLGNFYKIALNYYLGSQLDFNNEWDSSNIYLKKAYAVNSDDKSELKVKGFAGILLGNHLLMKEKTEEALKQFLLNLKLFETLKDSINQATSMLDIASVYKRLKMYDQNKQYLLASIPLSIAKKDTQNLWKAYNNLARLNELEVNKDTCLHYAKKQNLCLMLGLVRQIFLAATQIIYMAKACF